MDLLIKIGLFGGGILVGAALIYLASRMASRAYYKSKIEYDKRREEHEPDTKTKSGR
jgi:hypothetical protein